MKYNYLDLFHGIGGFALGAYWAGMKFDNHLCSDIEKYPVELYKKRFPDSIQLGDITQINWEKLKHDYPGEWILTGGFPCQDISIAGKGQGMIDEKGNKTRSGLWFDYWRGISILRPEFIIIENVRALLNRGLETVLSNLSEIGYNAEWQIISAEDMGAPHKRERVWIISYPSSYGSLQSDKKEPCERGNNFNKWNKNTNTIERQSENDKFEGPNMANTPSHAKRRNESRLRGQSGRKNKKEYENTNKEISNSNSNRSQGEWTESNRTGSIRLCNRKTERNQTNWTIEPQVGRLVNGLPGRVDRLKGLGNAIVPQIAELLFNQIKEYL